MKRAMAVTILIVLASVSLSPQSVRLLGVGSASFPAYSVGFDFRSTSGYVTDTGNNCYILATDTYPTTPSGADCRKTTGPFAGLTWGFTTTIDGCADRVNTNDARIAGICFRSNNQAAGVFRVTGFPVPATYCLVLAAGDASFPNTQTVVFQENGVAFAPNPVVGPLTATVANHFLASDAVDYTNVTWPTTGSTKCVTHTFSVSDFRVAFGDPSSGTAASTVAFVGMVRTG